MSDIKDDNDPDFESYSAPDPRPRPAPPTPEQLAFFQGHISESHAAMVSDGGPTTSSTAVSES